MKETKNVGKQFGGVLQLSGECHKTKIPAPDLETHGT